MMGLERINNQEEERACGEPDGNEIIRSFKTECIVNGTQIHGKARTAVCRSRPRRGERAPRDVRGRETFLLRALRKCGDHRIYLRLRHRRGTRVAVERRADGCIEVGTLCVCKKREHQKNTQYNEPL